MFNNKQYIKSLYMLTGNQWWLFKFSERLNILWLEETTGDDVFHVSVAAKNLYKLFHNKQENFTGISEW